MYLLIMKSDAINGIPVCCMQFKYMYVLNNEIRCNQWYCCNAQCPRCQGSCYRSILCSKWRIRITKPMISLGCFDPNTLRQIFLEIAWQSWHFNISLSLFDWKELLFDSRNVVQCIVHVVYSLSNMSVALLDESDRKCAVFDYFNFEWGSFHQLGWSSSSISRKPSQRAPPR